MLAFLRSNGVLLEGGAHEAELCVVWGKQENRGTNNGCQGKIYEAVLVEEKEKSP